MLHAQYEYCSFSDLFCMQREPILYFALSSTYYNSHLVLHCNIDKYNDPYELHNRFLAF